MRQADVADRLGLSRSALVQVEAGRRSVSGLELDRFAYLYGREVGEFLTGDSREEDTLVALFRLHPELAGDESALEAVRRSLFLGRAIRDLEDTLDIDAGTTSAPEYRVGVPAGKWQAVRQGERVADQERSRLGLGGFPLPDLVELLEVQGIRTAEDDLPDGVSGLTLIEARVGIFIVVNRRDAVLKKRFSLAHEYGHALLDRERPGTLSRAGDRATLPEVRANAFAAAFLMPRSGVEEVIRSLAKGGSSRRRSEVFDGNASVTSGDRSAPRSQEVQMHDLALLSRHFGVSRLAAAYRLRNLELMRQAALDRLLAEERRGLGRRVALLLGQSPPVLRDSAQAFRQRFLALGIEALRREEISRGKLRELARLVDVDEEELEETLEDAGLERPAVDAGPVDAAPAAP